MHKPSKTSDPFNTTLLQEKGGAFINILTKACNTVEKKKVNKWKKVIEKSRKLLELNQNTVDSD